MALSVGEIEATLRLRDEMTARLRAAAANVKQFGADMDRMGSKLTTVGASMSQLGRSMTVALTGPIVLLGGASVKAAMDFETAFANVRKTVEGSEPQLDMLAKRFRAISKEIPVTTSELAAIAALGGQMGVPVRQLERFTVHVAALGVAVDGISTEEAAAGLAQIGNAAGVGTAKTAELASALVHLGNRSSATEADILEFTKRLVGAGTTVGMTLPQVMAIGTAMANVGINAEMGGTAFSQVIMRMSQAVAEGDSALDAFARTAGMSAEAFSAQFRGAPIEAIMAFVSGLQRVRDEGGNVWKVFDEMETKGLRVKDVLQRVAGASTSIGDSLKIANEGYDAGNKHLEEAQKKYATVANQLKVFFNKLRDVGVELGNAFLPMLTRLVGALEPAVKWLSGAAQAFAKLPASVQAATAVVLALVAATGPLILFSGALVTAAGNLIKVAGGVATFAATSPVLTAALTRMTVAVRGLGAALAGPAGLVLLVAGLAASWALLKTSQIKADAEAMLQASGIIKKAVDNVREAKEVLDAFESGKSGQRMSGRVTLEMAEAWQKGAASVRQLGESAAIADSEIGATRLTIAGFGKATQAAGPPLREMNEELKKLVGELSGADLVKQARDYATALRDQGVQQHLSAEQSERIAGLLGDLRDAHISVQQVGEAAYARLVAAAAPYFAMLNQFPKDKIQLALPDIIPEMDPSTLRQVADDMEMAANTVFQKLAGAGLPVFDVLSLIGLNFKQPSAMQEAFKDAKTFGSGLGNVIQQSITGGGSIVSGIGSFVGQGLGKFAASSIGNSMGKLMGGVFDSLLPGIGSLLGPLVSKIGDLFKKPEWKKVTKDVGRDWGVNISENLAKAIETDSKRLRDRAAATLLHIGDIFKEAGGVAAFGFDKAVAKTRDLFVQIETGKLTVKEAGKAFDEAFGMVAAEAVDKTTGLVSRAFLELIALNDRFGTNSAQVLSFVTGQLSAAAAGLKGWAGGVAGALAAMTEAGKAKAEELGQEFDAKTIPPMVRSQTAATGLAGAVVASFDAMIARGMSAREALAAVESSVALLEEQFKQAGFEGAEAFAGIQSMATIVKDPIAGPLVDSVLALRDTFTGLHNAGVLNQTTFEGLARQVSDTFDFLVEQGHDGDAALRLMQPTLQTIWSLQKDFGFVVDESTQKLLTQAEEAGLVGEKHRTVNEQIRDGIKRIGDILETVFADKLPKAMDETAAAAGRIRKAVDDIPRNVAVNVDVGSSGDGGGGYAPPEFAGGTPRLDYVDFGAETPAALHGREAVVPESGVGAFASQVAAALGGRGGGAPIYITVVSELDGREVARNQVRYLPTELALGGR